MGGFETSIIPTVAPLLVLACVGIYVVSRHRKGSSARSLAVAWPQTMGTVLSATVQVSHHGNSRQEAPLVLYAYQVDGQVFQGHRMGLPICVELATGRKVWGGDIRNAGKGSAAIAYADSHLIFRYENGLVILIEATPAGYREKGQFEIPDASPLNWPYPAIADGKLYLRDQDRLLVYEIKGP